MYFWKCFKNVCGSALSFVVASLWHCWWNFLQQIPRNCFHQCKVYVPKVYFSEMYFWKFFFKVYSGLCPSGGTSKCIFQSMYIFHKYLFQKFIFPKCIFLQIHFFRVYSGPCPCGGTITLLVTSLISFGKCNLEKIQFSENFLEIPGNINVTAMYDNSLLATIYKDLPGNYLYQCQWINQMQYFEASEKVHFLKSWFKDVCLVGVED